MSREQIIAKHRSLFWYTPEAEKQNISDALTEIAVQGVAI